MKPKKKKKLEKIVQIVANGGFLYALTNEGDIYEFGRDNLTGAGLWDYIELPADLQEQY